MFPSITGNLPTERVTKRDLFHIFHKYGKLAQISIKQAYGFIQFLEAPACKQALDVEQGAVVRGRKVRKCRTSRHTKFLGQTNGTSQTLRYPSHREIRGQAQLPQNLPALHRLGARGLPNTAEGGRRAVATLELLRIATTDHTNLREFHSAISEMNLLTVGAMTIGLPLDPRPLVASAEGTGTGLGIEPQNVTIDGNDAGPGPPTQGTEDTAAPAHGPAGMKVM